MWCSTQRQRFKIGKITSDRIEQLAAIGFVWDLHGTWWEEMFGELIAYKNAHGNCNVPLRCKDNPALGTWCSKQRKAYKLKDLSADQVRQMQDIGFAWDPRFAAWDEMFTALVIYKKTHGDCRVPAGWKGNPRLASWCNQQKQRSKIGKVTSDRIERLKGIGFDFRVRDATQK